MVKFIIGAKGSGKTNKLIESVNEAVKIDKGQLVFINDSKRHMFDLNQTVYVVDPSTGHKNAIAVTTMEELPEVISAICDSQKVYKVMLTGNSIYGAAVAEDILAFSKQHYSWNNIEVEVIK